MIKLENTVLYYRPDCPYCKKVLDFLEEYSLEVEKKDITDQLNEDELIHIGSRKQVPCLVIDGQAMYESEDIIAYLRTKVA